jgi:hypothetical protein
VGGAEELVCALTTGPFLWVRSTHLPFIVDTRASRWRSPRESPASETGGTHWPGTVFAVNETRCRER